MAAGPGDMARDMARTAPAWQVLGVPMAEVTVK